MEDIGERVVPTTANQRSIGPQDPKKKYVDILQRVADRQLSEICIELDDVEAVSGITVPRFWA